MYFRSLAAVLFVAIGMQVRRQKCPTAKKGHRRKASRGLLVIHVAGAGGGISSLLADRRDSLTNIFRLRHKSRSAVGLLEDSTYSVYMGASHYIRRTLGLLIKVVGITFQLILGSTAAAVVIECTAQSKLSLLYAYCTVLYIIAMFWAAACFPIKLYSSTNGLSSSLPLHRRTRPPEAGATFPLC